MSKKKRKRSPKEQWLKRRRAAALRRETAPRCGLCGKTENLTRTECCGNWICDDEGAYVMFSYERSSCYRNHRRYTLCGHHWAEGHEGRWQDCKQCREDFEDELEMYVYYGTNDYNFEVLENPPHYEPTKCRKCGKVIVMAEEDYSSGVDGYLCETCSLEESPDLLRALGLRVEDPFEVDDEEAAEEETAAEPSGTASIPEEVQERVLEKVATFNRKSLTPGTVSYVPRFKGKYVYLNRKEYDRLSRICRLTWTGKEDDWDFAIFKYSSERYDPDEWMFPGAGAVDGTVEGAMVAGLEAYPA